MRPGDLIDDRFELVREAGPDAMVHAESAMEALHVGPIDDGEATVRLVFAEALRATGRAALISGGPLRAHFLNDVPENARTLALAKDV